MLSTGEGHRRALWLCKGAKAGRPGGRPDLGASDSVGSRKLPGLERWRAAPGKFQKKRLKTPKLQGISCRD